MTTWLKLQVFVSGFAVMGLELLGSRLITPVFGSSIWTWGSLIGVVLAGLSAGYQFGGKIADRSPTRKTFSMILLLGGILVVMVPLVAPFALSVSLYAPLGDQYRPLLATTLILGVQTVILGMTSPYAVRLASKSLTSIGKVTGNLYSMSTLGGIAGTFGTVFVLIPVLDVRTIVSGLGLVLMLVSLPALPRKSSSAAVLILFIMVSPFFFPTSPKASVSIDGGSVVYEKETPYSTLDVVDFSNVRVLYLNGFVHSGMDPANTTQLVYQYTTYFNLGMQLKPDARSVLFVGGGGFSGPKFFLAMYPNVQVDVAEIDPDVINTAQNYFALKPDPRLTIFNEDARVYLGETDKAYDVIILDAYAKTYVPFHLMTQEFFKLLSAHLSHDGVVISNLIGSLVGDTSNLLRAEYSTATEVFSNSALFETVPYTTAVQNVEIALRKSQTPSLVSSISQIDDEMSPRSAQAASNSIIPIGGYVTHLYASAVRVDDVPQLTDNYAPVETLLNPVTQSPYVLEKQFGRLVPTTPVPEWQTILTIGAGSLLGALVLVNASRKSEPDLI